MRFHYLRFVLQSTPHRNRNDEYGAKSALNRRLKVDQDGFPVRMCVIWHTLDDGVSRRDANVARARACVNVVIYSQSLQNLSECINISKCTQRQREKKRGERERKDSNERKRPVVFNQVGNLSVTNVELQSIANAVVGNFFRAHARATRPTGSTGAVTKEGSPLYGERQRSHALVVRW